MSDRNEMLSNDINNAYIAILKEELRPAMGCTEPIAIAYAAAKAREVLGALPDRLVLEVSGTINIYDAPLLCGSPLEGGTGLL